jgi:hypothetical protein
MSDYMNYLLILRYFLNKSFFVVSFFQLFMSNFYILHNYYHNFVIFYTYFHGNYAWFRRARIKLWSHYIILFYYVIFHYFILSIHVFMFDFHYFAYLRLLCMHNYEILHELFINFCNYFFYFIKLLIHFWNHYIFYSFF